MGNLRTPGASVNETERSQGQQQVASNDSGHLISPLGGVTVRFSRPEACSSRFLRVSPRSTGGQTKTDHSVSLEMRSWFYGCSLAASSECFPAFPLLGVGKLPMILVVLVFGDLCPFFLSSLWGPRLSLYPGISHHPGTSILLRSLHLYSRFGG